MSGIKLQNTKSKQSKRPISTSLVVISDKHL